MDVTMLCRSRPDHIRGRLHLTEPARGRMLTDFLDAYVSLRLHEGSIEAQGYRV